MGRFCDIMGQVRHYGSIATLWGLTTCRPVSKKLVRDLFHDRAQILRDRVSKIKFQAVLNTDHYRYRANKRTDGPEIPQTH